MSCAFPALHPNPGWTPTLANGTLANGTIANSATNANSTTGARETAGLKLSLIHI